ncbi:ras-related protein Rab-32 isoform X2 [Episyrphus balteatus]|uniref:ras-related protein Rab-32 isoform X2 n=1 Tax=Episyrphus balteatus TaxID=286459 RepID=UPI002485577C|nr:ras-related protein Rab-32 isoform X2 [Episyrphus balteatus]
MATTVIRVAVSNSCRRSTAEQYRPTSCHQQQSNSKCCQHSRGYHYSNKNYNNSNSLSSNELNSKNIAICCVCCAASSKLKRHQLASTETPCCALLDSQQAIRLKSNLKKCLHKHFQSTNKHTAAVDNQYLEQDQDHSLERSLNKMTDIKRNGFTRNGPIMTSSQEKREHLYKILVIGELGTGKTSFIKRYVHQFFSQNYRATIGVDFALKVLNWDSNTIVRLQLWDIAGQERFGNMTRVYYKEAVGAFIVFDVTRSGTFDCVSKWKEDLDSKVQLPDGSPIPCILLANKCDQDKQGIITTPEKMDEYVRENGFAGWFETSAKENINIDEAARALVNKILLNDKLISDADIADSEKFNLANSNGGQTTTQAIKSKCSC